MRVAESLLVSRGEEKLFSRLNATFAGLEGAWVPQLTFSKLIRANRGEVVALAGSLRDPFGWYLQTSVDLTFVLEHPQRPIFSIEFDGLGKGFSRDGSYLSGRPDPDPHRSQKLALKVRMAEEAGYPLVVIGPDELQPVSTASARIIAEGIAACVLSDLLWQQEMASYARRNRIEVDALTVDQRQGLAWEFRRQTRQRLDPFQQAVDTLIADLPPNFSPTESMTALLDPPATDASNPQDVMSAQRAAARVGAEVILEVPSIRVRRSVWMRNIVLPLDRGEPIPPGVLSNPNVLMSGLRIGEDVTRRVARYLAYIHLCDRVVDAAESSR